MENVRSISDGVEFSTTFGIIHFIGMKPKWSHFAESGALVFVGDSPKLLVGFALLDGLPVNELARPITLNHP